MSVMFLPLRLIPVPVQCVVLSSVLQLFLNDNEKLQDTIEHLEGKVFRIYVKDTGAVMFMGFKAANVWVHPSSAQKPDVKIESTTAGFARLAFAKEDPDALVFQKVLKLSGDSQAMLLYQKLLKDLDLDWEAELRAIFGDFFGQKVAKAAHAAVAAEKKMMDGSVKMVDDCLRSAHAPDQERMQLWQAGVESAFRKVGKLKRRIDALEHMIEKEKV